MTMQDEALTSEHARQAAEIEAVRRVLDLSAGNFSLSIAVCNSPALRDHIIEKLKESHPKIDVVAIPEGTQDILAHIEGQIDAASCSVVFVVGLENVLKSTETRHPAIRQLNAAREMLERSLLCPVVLWLPEFAAGTMAREAPDLWRYRSHRFEFVSEQAGIAAGIMESPSSDFIGAGNLSADEKRFRIAELEQRLEEAGPRPPEQLAVHVSIWLTELGFLHEMLGDLDKAEAMHRKALAMDEGFGRKENVAADYGNLGEVYRIKGDLDAAEEMCLKSLAIYEELGRKEGMAANYGNLGILYEIKGDLNAAEEMYHKSLAIDEKLGSKEGMAVQYVNLGNLYRIRGDLDAAEEMCRKSLAIDEELGRKEGMARNYGNLGILYADRGDLYTAEKMLRMALAIAEELGSKEDMAIQYGNLGNVYYFKGDLNAAEEMYHKSLAIDEKLGRKEGMANQYGNLGNLYSTKGDLDAAEEMSRKALALYRDVGAKPMIEKMERRLQELKSSD